MFLRQHELIVVCFIFQSHLVEVKHGHQLSHRERCADMAGPRRIERSQCLQPQTGGQSCQIRSGSV
jgi:hypothetical protein